jgi:hypothetical protein
MKRGRASRQLMCRLAQFVSELVREVIIWILGPCDPDRGRREFLERILGLDETRQMVPVLMSYRDDVDALIGVMDQVLNHPSHRVDCSFRAEHDAAIDQKLEVVAIRSLHPDQNAVAEPLTIDPDGSPRSVSVTCAPVKALVGGRADTLRSRGAPSR